MEIQKHFLMSLQKGRVHVKTIIQELCGRIGRFFLKVSGQPEHPDCIMCTLLEQRLKDVIRNLEGVIFFAVNKKGIFREVFGGGLKLLSSIEGNIIGTSAFSLYGNNEKLIEGFQRALQGEQVEIETVFKRRNGTSVQQLFFRIFFHPHYAHGKITGAVGIAIDITAVVESRLEAQKERILAQKADMLKSAFLANMSHEIRTPMNAIIGFSQLMKDENISFSQIKEYTDIIEQNGRALLTLIEDILDLSKIQANQMKIRNGPVNMYTLLENAVIQIEQLSLETKKDLVIISEYRETLAKDCVIVSDEIRVRQILANLLSNAVKFTDNGFVKIRCVTSDTKITVDIEDSGRGIPDSMKHEIFSRFNRIEDHSGTKQRTTTGTGLGLAISKSLVELLDGEIGFESQEGIGSVFSFSLPYSKEDNKQDTEEKKTIDRSPTDLKNIRILIAEDTDTNYLYLENILKGENVVLTRAYNGQEAIEKYADADVILMDIKMPIMDGYEATKRIRKLDAQIPIIGQSAYAMAGDREEALSMGFTEYVTKPIDRKKLMTIIKQVSGF